jgi:hypothetical protein
MKNDRSLMNVKELSAALGRHRNYVSAMRRSGFQMPRGMATLADAEDWIRCHPSPRSKRSKRVSITLREFLDSMRA